MERDSLKWLLKWKDKRNRKPLLMTGVRQCGKTYIIKAFGRQEFDDMAYFSRCYKKRFGHSPMRDRAILSK